MFARALCGKLNSHEEAETMGIESQYLGEINIPEEPGRNTHSRH